MLEVEGDFKVGSIQSERENDTDIPFQAKERESNHKFKHVLAHTFTNLACSAQHMVYSLHLRRKRYAEEASMFSLHMLQGFPTMCPLA